MRASLNYLGLWAASAVAAVAAAAAEAAAGPTTSLTLQIGQPRLSAPAQQGGAASASADGFQAVLNGVPSWTRATLEAGGGRQYVSAPVTAIGQLVFANVTTGSYLAEVHCATHIFPPMRVDIAVDPSATGPAPPLFIAASETYRGNDWGNRGEALVRLDSVDTAVQSGRPASTYQSPTFVVRPFSALPKAYYTERSSFSALSILRNPMILLAMVSMAIMFGMPYLIDNSKTFSSGRRRDALADKTSSGPGDAPRVRGAAKVQPDERPAGQRWRRRWCCQAKLRYGGVPGRQQQRGKRQRQCQCQY